MQELCRPNRAVGIGRPGRRFVRDLDPLAIQHKKHRVITNDVAGTKRREPDATGLPQRIAAVPVKNGNGVQRLPARMRGDLTQHQSSTGRRVNL